MTLLTVKEKCSLLRWLDINSIN